MTKLYSPRIGRQKSDHYVVFVSFDSSKMMTLCSGARDALEMIGARPSPFRLRSLNVFSFVDSDVIVRPLKAPLHTYNNNARRSLSGRSNSRPFLRCCHKCSRCSVHICGTHIHIHTHTRLPNTREHIDVNIVLGPLSIFHRSL